MKFKETEEAIVALETLVKDVKEAKADGVLDPWDIPTFIDTASAMWDAVNGGHLIPGEVKELSSAELKSLLQRVLTAMIELGNALKK